MKEVIVLGAGTSGSDKDLLDLKGKEFQVLLVLLLPYACRSRVDIQ